MRILHVINHIGIGGAETYVRNLACAQHDQGHDVGIAVCLRGGAAGDKSMQPVRDRQIPVFFLNASSGHDLRLPFALLKVLSGFKPERIHLSSLPLLAPLALFFCRAPKFVTLHLLPNRQRRKRVNEWLYGPIVTGVIAVSDAVRGAYEKTGAFRHARWTRIHNGIDLGGIPEKPERTAPEPDERFILAMACRMEPEKCAEDALHIMACLKKQCPRQPLLLQLIGTGSLLSRLQAAAGELGVADMVEFTGYREDVPEFFRKAHGVLILSRQESFPFAALEAMAAGTPVFRYEMEGGIGEMHRDGGAGAVAAERTPEAMAACVRNAVETPDLWIAYSRNAVETAKKFPLSVMVGATTGFYHQS